MDTRGNIKPAPAYERILRLFADVHPREGATSLILVANIFLILVGTRMFHLGNFGFVMFNICLVLVWIGLSAYLHREHEQWKLAVAIPPARDFSHPADTS